MDKLATALREVAEFGLAGFSIDVNPRRQTVDVVISNGPKTRTYNGVFKVGIEWRDNVASALFEATAPFRADVKAEKAKKRDQLKHTSAAFNKQQDEIESLQAQLVEAQNRRDKLLATTQKLREELGEQEGFQLGGVIKEARIEHARINGEVPLQVAEGGTFIAVSLSGGDENVSAVSKEVAAAIAKKS